MREGLAVPLALGVLALIALGVAGWLPAALLPTTPAGGLAATLGVVGLFLVGVMPFTARHAPSRTLLLLLAALPFLLQGVLETPSAPGRLAWPDPGWWQVLLAGLLLSALAGAGRRALLVGVLVLWAGDALLASAGAGVLPPGWSPLSDVVSTAAVRAPPSGAAAWGRGPVGWRAGAPLVLPAPPPGASGPGPWYEPAARGRAPADLSLVLVVGARENETPADQTGAALYVPDRRDRDLYEHPLELDAFDAAVVLPNAWDALSPDADRIADALADYARRGGLLVGPVRPRAWPEPLGERLGRGGRRESGATTPFGLGRVGHAGSPEEARRLLAGAASWHPPVTTALDAGSELPPALPSALGRWEDRPQGRRAQGLLLLAYAFVAGCLERVLRSAPRWGALGAVALVTGLGLWLTSPNAPGVRLHAMAFDLGGGGGRRVEAVAFSAGPAGWEGDVTWSGGGVLRWVGGDLDGHGRLFVEPRRVAWAIRETLATGETPASEGEGAGVFLRRLLTRGGGIPGVETGRGRALPVRVQGLSVPLPWLLSWR